MGEAAGDRVLIVGGTFDPPHLAHTRLAAEVARRKRCGRILFIPAAVSPFKTGEPPTASAGHRVAMLRLAVKDIPGAEVNEIEVARAGKSRGTASFTIDTLRELSGATGGQKVGGAQPTQASRLKSKIRRGGPQAFYLLLGCDQALAFYRWKEWQEILKLAEPVVVLRPPWDPRKYREALIKEFGEAEAEQWMKWTLLPDDGLPLMDVSATEIRERIRKGESVEGMVAAAVVEYIRREGAYRG